MSRLLTLFSAPLFLMTSCLSALPLAPECYEEFDDPYLILPPDNIPLCCQTQEECVAFIRSSFKQSDGIDPLDYTCSQGVCAVKQGTANGAPCNENRDCSVGELCEFGQCITDSNVDRDADGIPDQLDACPDIPNPGEPDCDENGLPDACDPAGPCGGQLIGSLISSEGRQAPTPCALLEVEGTNIRGTVDERGNYQLSLKPDQVPREVLVFKREKRDGACVLNEAPHLSPFHQLPISSVNLSVADLEESYSLDLYIDPPVVIRGRVMRANLGPNSLGHGGIQVRVVGPTSSVTLTDPSGHFELKGLRPTSSEQSYQVLMSAEGYQTSKLTGLKLSAESDTCTLDMASGGGEVAACQEERRASLIPPQRGVCRATLEQIRPEEVGGECGVVAGAELACSSTGDSPYCLPRQLTTALVLSQSSEVEEKIEVEVTLSVLTMPAAEQWKVNPSPSLTIIAHHAGDTLHVNSTELEVMDTGEDQDHPWQISRWRGALAPDDLYTLVAEAGDPQHTMIGRFSGVALDALTPNEQGRISFQFTLVPRRLADAEDGSLHLDLDGDRLPDELDEDRDNDGCVDATDSDPNNPYVCLPASMGRPQEHLADADGDGLSDLEESTLGRDGDWTDLLAPHMDQEPIQISTSSDRLTSIRFLSSGAPLVSPHRAHVFSSGPAAILTLAEGSEAGLLSLSVELPFDPVFDGDASSWIVALSREDCLNTEETECELAALTLCDDTHDGTSIMRCSAEFSLPPEMSGERMLWFYRAPPFNAESTPPTLEPRCTSICPLNIETEQSIYSLLRRGYLTDTNEECLFSATSGFNAERLFSVQPLLLSELMKQCHPIRINSISLTSPDCRIAPLYSSPEEGPIQIKSVSFTALPPDCDGLNDQLTRMAQPDALSFSEACLLALGESDETRITLKLVTQRGEGEVNFNLRRGDEIGRCIAP